MKISEMVKVLNSVKKQSGDREVFMAGDSEGNTFGTVDRECSFSFPEESNNLFIYPAEELLYEDIMA